MQVVRPLIGAAVTGVFLLSGCSGGVSPEPTATSAAPSPSATETTPEGDGTFGAPADCTAILPQDQVDSYSAENIVLLAGPGGIYGDELIPDPTPETIAGGISCYFGYDNEDPNQIQIYSVVSVAEVTAGNRDSIMTELSEQGLNEGTDATGAATYAIIGDTAANVPAMYNVVDDYSWISVISVFGGETFFEENVAIAGMVHDQVYN
jgi:hypothetical protein